MTNITDTEKTYKTIGEVTKELGLINKKTGTLQTHTIRYWETQFKQIKPEIKAGKRRYYSKKNIQKIKQIKYLLKDRGLTIKGVKKLFDDNNVNALDDNVSLKVYKSNKEKEIKIKKRMKKIVNILKELKNFKDG